MYILLCTVHCQKMIFSFWSCYIFSSLVLLDAFMISLCHWLFSSFYFSPVLAISCLLSMHSFVTSLAEVRFHLMSSLVPFLRCGLCCSLASAGPRLCLFLIKHEPTCRYHSCDQICVVSNSLGETIYSPSFYIFLSWRTCTHSSAVHFDSFPACILLPCSQSFQMPHRLLDGHFYSLSWIYSTQPCRTHRLLFAWGFVVANPLSHFSHWYCFPSSLSSLLC